ncbi:hypothetical protein O1611_g8969 [Lasiodiplodia mahajangana]|uniref:Uncharacterized protein n=1 Tax=Lasiodiplodia mahajangana TaxID=1108764 RepID=A0ACC2JB12_9PEZI|nr:hypothetical protein O1611_g8969 [Lasiodiplodia mahajangana]
MANHEKANLSGPGSPEDFLDFWHIHRDVILVVVILFCSMTWMLYSSLPTRRVVKKLPERTAVATKPAPVKSISSSEKKLETLSEAPPPDVAARGPRRIKGELRKPETTRRASGSDDSSRRTQVLVFYSSLTTTTEKIANDFAQNLSALLEGGADSRKDYFLKPTVLDLAQVDYDEYFISPPKHTDTTMPVDYFYLFLIPSYNIDTINDNLLEHLQETHHDFRIDTAPLSGLLGYSVFGLGDREGWPTEEDGFCFQAKEVDRWMAKLTGRKRAYPLGIGDKKQDLTDRLREWTDGVTDVLKLTATTGSLGEGVPGSGDADESDYEYASGDDGDEVEVEASTTLRRRKNTKKSNIDDVEDLGRMINSSQADSKGSKGPTPIAIDFTTYNKPSPKKPATPS